jgi:hypothetical protein
MTMSEAAGLVARRDQDAAVLARGASRSRFPASPTARWRTARNAASRPLPEIGANCHELRVIDRDATWRIVYHVGDNAIVVLEVFSKKTRTLPDRVVTAAKRRLKEYLRIVQED